MSWAHCKATGKALFRTEQDAERALRQAQAKRDHLLRARVKGIVRSESRYYECDYGEHFHLTSMPLKAYERTVH